LDETLFDLFGLDATLVVALSSVGTLMDADSLQNAIQILEPHRIFCGCCGCFAWVATVATTAVASTKFAMLVTGLGCEEISDLVHD
jgi:hypothetical protein